ncbi:MAG TPA: glycosyltransferase [Candidatus Eisenbacteria bacterium]|nr:glycosyltransferase [Candidatus Eisenbacteria bacterium]
MRVAFVGGFDPDYPRTRGLREGLETQGVEVRSLPVSPRAGFGARQASIIASWATRGAGADAFLVPSFGHRDVALLSLLARVSGAPLLFDPLVSRWDTQVRDIGRVLERTPSAARLRLSDRISMGLADTVLCDTWEHGEFFSTAFGVPRRKLARVPVGADREAFARGAARPIPDPAAGFAPGSAPDASRRPLEVAFVGGFLPLHGMAVIVQAAARLEARHGPDFARFTLAGHGMHAYLVDRDIAAFGLRSVRRLPRIPYGDALSVMAKADVALGIFGVSEKAGRVVPHKVYQSLALGVPTVTRRSAAIAEFFRDGRDGRDGRKVEELVTIPAGDAPALARALEELAVDPARRARIGAAGRAAALVHGTPDRIGEALVEAIVRSRAATAPRAKR